MMPDLPIPSPSHERRKSKTSALVAAGLLVLLLAVIPACSSSPTTPSTAATSPPTTATSPSTTATTTSVTLPNQNPAEEAACVADGQSVETALAAYMAEHGSYPAPSAPWSAATYATNYAPLAAASDGGPFLRSAPGTKFYVIAFDSAGHVWITPPGAYGPYNAGQDLSLQPDVCDAAVG